MSGDKISTEKEVYRQKKTFARAICNALINKDKEALHNQLRKVLWERFDIKEICSLETGDGKSPIRYAITQAAGDISMLQLLKSKGNIDYDVRLAPEQMTVLHLAVRVQDKAVLRYLIKHGNVKINATDSEGETALHCAIRACTSVEICSVLLKAGIKVDKTDKRQQTALHVALDPLIACSKQKVELLCKEGASPNARDQNGNTALHLLLKRRPADLLEKLSILMKLKPEKGLVNNNNQTALDLYLDHTDNDADEVYKVNAKFLGKSHSTMQSSPQILVVQAPEVDDDQSIIRSRIGSLSRRRTSSLIVKEQFAKARNSFLRRFSARSAASHSRKSSTCSQAMGDNELLPDDLEQDAKFPDVLERQQLVAAFVQSLSEQKDDEERSISDCESDVSSSEYRGSPGAKNNGYMTSDDDGSFYSKYANSRRGSFLEAEFDTPAEVNGNSLKYHCRQNGLNCKANDSREQVIKHNLCNGGIVTSGNLRDGDSSNALRRTSSLSKLPTSKTLAEDQLSRRTSSLHDMRGMQSIVEVTEVEVRTPGVIITVQDLDAGGNDDPSPRISRVNSFSSSDESGADASGCGSSIEKSQSVVSVQDISALSDVEDMAMNSSAVADESKVQEDAVDIGAEAFQDQYIPADDFITECERVSTATIKAICKPNRKDTLTEFQKSSFRDSEEEDGEEQEQEVEDALFSQLNLMSEEDCITYLTTSATQDVSELKDANKKEGLLHLATRRSFVKLIYFLMAKDIDIDSVDRRGWTSLHIAAEIGNMAIIKMLMGSGASKEMTTIGGHTTLSIAAFYSHSDVVTFLLQEGDVSASYLELSMHQLLKTRRSKEITQLYVRHIEARKHANDIEVHLIIPLAAKRQHWNVINFILAQQKRKKMCVLELNKRDADGYCAAHYCSMHGSLPMLRKLKEAGASIVRKRKLSSEREQTIETVLSIARDKGFTDIVKYIKERKQSANLLELP